MATGTHDHADDPRNADILIWVNGELVPRERAMVSVFDSGFVLGDGVWEGLRVSGGHPAFLEQHLDRLEEGARAIMLDLGLSREELTDAIYATLRANEMTDGVHVRLMVTRGVKSTPYQDPRDDDRPGDRGDHRRAQGADAGDGHRRDHAVHHARTPGHAGHARPEAQRAQQAQRHPGLHPGLHGRRRRGADARPARVRGHLQQHPLLHRHPRRRGVDLRRPVLPRRDHPRQRARGVPRQRDPGARDDVQPDRRLQRGRGVRDRHLRRGGAGAHRRRPHDRVRRARAGHPPAAGALPAARGRGRGGRDDASGWRCGRGRATSPRR